MIWLEKFLSLKTDHENHYQAIRSLFHKWSQFLSAQMGHNMGALQNCHLLQQFYLISSTQCSYWNPVCFRKFFLRHSWNFSDSFDIISSPHNIPPMFFDYLLFIGILYHSLSAFTIAFYTHWVLFEIFNIWFVKLMRKRRLH